MRLGIIGVNVIWTRPSASRTGFVECLGLEAIGRRRGRGTRLELGAIGKGVILG